MIHNLEQTERELNQRNSQNEIKYLRDQKHLQRKLLESEQLTKTTEEKCNLLARELQNKQLQMLTLQEQISRFESTKTTQKSKLNIDSLTDLTNVDLDVDLDNLSPNELIEYCLDLRSRFEKAVLEIRSVKRELRDSYAKYDSLELTSLNLRESLGVLSKERETEGAQMAARIDHLTSKLSAAEKQLRSKTRQESRDKRRSLSLKGEFF